VKLVKHLLDTKGRHIVSVTPDTSVLDAIKLMADKTVGSVVVMESGELCGIMTERDYSRKVIIADRSSSKTMVAEIMTADVVTTSSAKTVDDCMGLMAEKGIRHLPVVEDQQVIGMISVGDIVQAIIADQKQEIEQLEHSSND